MAFLLRVGIAAHHTFGALTLPMPEANGCCPAIPNSCLTSQEGTSVSVGDGPHHSEYTMVDSFVFQIDWRIVASVIGLIAALIALFSYARRNRD
jgi:hypothetical protein